MKWLNFIVDTIFPPDKAVKRLESMSVNDLLAKISIGKTDDDIFFLFKYKDPDIRTALVTIKDYYNTKIFKLLGKSTQVGLFKIIESEKLNNPLLIPVAMTGKSKRKRGWNQCEIICKEISNGVCAQKIEYRSDILMKVRDTKDQVGHGRASRMENLRNSFAVKPRFIECVKNRNVIILDDIVTTGSTLTEAKRAIKDSGCAGKIICVAVAH